MQNDQPPWRYGGPLGPKPPEFEPVPRYRKQRLRDNPYRGRAGAAAYQRKTRELKDSPAGGVCWICGRDIDRTLPPSESWRSEAWTADHDPPLAAGGSLLEGLRPAHRGCNSSAGRAMQLEGEIPEGAPAYHPLPDGGFTQTPHLNPSDPGYIENSRAW